MEQLLKSALERDPTTSPRKAKSKSTRHSRKNSSGSVLPSFARLVPSGDSNASDGVGSISSHAAALYEDTLFVYGGEPEGERKKSTSLFSIPVGEALGIPSPSWKEHQSKEPPPAVFNHTATVVGDEMWVFGGRYEEDTPTKHIYKFYFLGDVWEEIEASGSVPQPRFGHTASLVNGNEIFVFGGQGRTDDNDSEINILGDAYLCITQSESWSMVIPKETTPSKRAMHSAATVDNKVYVFGGFNGVEYFNDVHIFDAATKDWAPVTFAPGSKMPAPRAGHACAYVGDGKIVIHGGYSLEGIFNDYWVLDTKAREWHALRSSAPGQPTGRHSHSLTFDPSARALLMIGGIAESGPAQDAHFVIALESLLASAAPDSPRAPPPAIQVDEPKAAETAPSATSEPTTEGDHDKEKNKENEKEKDAEDSDEEESASEDSAAREVLEARTTKAAAASPRDGSKTPKEGDNEEGIDYERLYAEQQRHLQQLQATVHDLDTRLSDARVQVSSREEQLALLKQELEAAHSTESGTGAGVHDARTQRGQRIAMMELVHLWNQRNGYQTQLVQLQKHLEATDVRIQEKLSNLSMSMNLAGLLAFLPQSIAKSDHKREGSDDSTSPRDEVTSAASKGSIDNFKKKHLDDKPKLKKSYSKSSGVGLKPSSGGMTREKSGTSINIDSAASAPSEPSVLSPTSEEREKARQKERSEKDLAKALKSAERDAQKKAKEEKKATVKDDKKDVKDKGKDDKKKDEKKKDDKKDEKKDDKKEKATIKSGADAADIKSAKFKLGNFLLGRQAGTQPSNAKKGDFKPVLDFSLVDICCKAIEKELDTVGVFRIPGSASAVDRIYASFADPATLTFAPDESLHNIAGAFKLYLRSLEDPVLPFDLHDDAIRIATVLRETPNAPAALEEAKALIAKLPELNSRILGRVVQLLTLTAQKSELNKMDIQNVAIVFGPTLVRQHPSKETPLTIMESTEKSRGFVAILLEHANDMNFKK